MRLASVAAAIAAMAMMPQAAVAAVTYTFTGTHQDFDAAGNQLPDATATFTVTTSRFITSARDVTPASWTAGGLFYTCGATQRFEPYPNGFGPGVGGDFIGLNLDNVDGSGGFTGFYFFRPGAFGAAGTYVNAGYPDPAGGYGNAGAATLVVSGAADSAVPEASSWALMIAGLGGVGAVLRRRRVSRPLIA